MAWTAEIAKVERSEGALYVTVAYSDGKTGFIQQHRHVGPPPSEWIEKVVAQKLAQLAAVDEVVISPGPVKVPTPAADPTPPDEKRAAFRRNMARLSRVAELVAIGALVKTDAAVVDLVAAIKSDLATYWEDL